MDIRRLGPGDESRTAMLLETLLRPEDHGYRAPSTASLARFLENPDYYLIAEIENATGFLVAYRFDRVDRATRMVYLYDILVASSHRRQRVGRQMIEALKTLCHKDQVMEIWVGSAPSNRAACALWESTGARRVAEAYVEYVYPPEAIGTKNKG